MTPFLTIRVVLEAGAALGFMLLSVGVLGRPFCFRRQLTVREARMTQVSDILLWVGAMVVVVAHLGLWFSVVGLGTWFYLSNPLQITQVVLFLGILVLDVWPARKFRSWSRYLDLDQVPYFTDREYLLIRRIWRIQAVLMVVLPVFTPLIRMGIGLSR